MKYLIFAGWCGERANQAGVPNPITARADLPGGSLELPPRSCPPTGSLGGGGDATAPPTRAATTPQTLCGGPLRPGPFQWRAACRLADQFSPAPSAFLTPRPPPAGRRATAEPLHRHRLHSLCATRANSQSYTRISGTPLRRPRSDLAPTSSSHRPVCRLHARHVLSLSFSPASPLPPSSLPPPRSSHLPISHPPWRS